MKLGGHFLDVIEHKITIESGMDEDVNVVLAAVGPGQIIPPAQDVSAHLNFFLGFPETDVDEIAKKRRIKEAPSAVGRKPLDDRMLN